eukprot:1000170-Ditylum_brightwellii.AAC.1
MVPGAFAGIRVGMLREGVPEAAYESTRRDLSSEGRSHWSASWTKAATSWLHCILSSWLGWDWV